MVKMGLGARGCMQGESGLHGRWKELSRYKEEEFKFTRTYQGACSLISHASCRMTMQPLHIVGQGHLQATSAIHIAAHTLLSSGLNYVRG